MEIPELEELQWLEANENDEDFDFDVDLDLDLDLEKEEEDVGGTGTGSRNENESGDDGHFEPSPSPSPSLSPNIKKKRLRNFEDEVEIEDEVRVRVKVQNDFKYLSRYASEIDGDCMPITAPSSSGERVYAFLDKHLFTTPSLNPTSFPISTGLISEPVHILLQKAEQDALLKALQVSSEIQNNDLLPETSIVTQELWVNKYAPKSFTELLSDENTNREVLIWLKQWDHTVFGTNIINTGEEVLSALKRHSSIPHHQKHSDSSFTRKTRGSRFTEKYTSFSTTLEHESIKSKGVQGLQTKAPKGSGAPDHKVLLLCGPPGMGKTTLAHVVAKHCGYHVVEINASDDRSSSIIEAKILDAMQMNSVMGDSKPKCLVIDEIDGALGEGKGAVDIIVKMVAAERKFHAGKEISTTEGQSGSGSLKKGRKSVSLSRPVICICNDLYAPPLRPLRLIAKVHVFAQPSVSRVVSRLKYICNKEGVKSSSIALTALAEYTECDIRSCLNTLQFLHKKKESLNLGALSTQVIGRKDITRSLFDIWKEVFLKHKMKQSLNQDATQIKAYDAHNSLYSMISNRGDYELIVDGIHENFLRMHYHDPMLQKTVHCLNDLGLSDLFHQCFIRSHNTFLCAYHTPIIIHIHHLLAHGERPIIEWPKSFPRYRLLLMEKLDILRSWQCKIPPCISRHLSVHSFVEDTVSPLLSILSPVDLRPVALHLLSEKEKNDLAQLVSTMVSYSLTYKNMKFVPSSINAKHEALTDASFLSFDPPIPDFVSFKDIKPGYCELKSAVKQVIVHEVEKQKIVQKSTVRCMNCTESRKENSAASGNEISIHSSKVQDASCSAFSIERKKNMSRVVILESQVKKGSSSLSFGGRSEALNLDSNGNAKPPLGSFNFFDRFKNFREKHFQDLDSPLLKTMEERDSRPLLFKFNEGFTNAVKKPVRMREFLL